MGDQSQYHVRNDCLDCLREDNAALVKSNEELAAQRDYLLEALKEAVKIIDEEWDIEWEQGHAAIKRATDA